MRTQCRVNVAFLINAHHTHHSLQNSIVIARAKLCSWTLTLGSKIPGHFIILVHIQLGGLEKKGSRSTYKRGGDF